MDIQAMQSMDWLFKKERIYLLAQFWQQRATLAEKEVSALKEQLATANQNLQIVEGKGIVKTPDMDQHTMDLITRSSLEVELAAKDKEISQLVEDVQRLQASLAKLQDTTASQMARLEEQLDNKRQHVARLESRLDSQRDYDDVKRELSILRSLEFPALGPEGSSKSLEMLLLERSKALQASEAPKTSASSSSCSEPQGSTTVTTTSSSLTSHQPPESLLHPLESPQVAPTGPPLPPPAASSIPPPGPPSSLLFPPPLQNVETFGSFLGEEIVANWRRSLERTILSQSHVGGTTAAATAAPTSGGGNNNNPPTPLQTSSSSHNPVGPSPSVISTTTPTTTTTSPTNQQLNLLLHSPTDAVTTPSSSNPPTPQQVQLPDGGVVDKVPPAPAELSSGDSPQPPPAPSSNNSASSFANSIAAVVSTTSAITSPLTSTTMTSSNAEPSSLGLHGLFHHHHHQQQQHHLHHQQHHHHLMNGNPKTPPEDSPPPMMCSNSNNMNSLVVSSALSGVSNNGMNHQNPPVSTSALSFFRNDESMKSPFRFDDPRSPFRFTEDGALTPSGVMVGRLGESLIPKGDPMEARLQEMLRYNMDKYSTQNLDTLHISRRVRELLSINNIGQRLFAKYVLGLSQGTVSELLSKPKPWDKLTEKGRDSYRKMHAWACDENAVLLLKSLIPKKGKDTGIPAFARGDAENMTEERIAHILSEASQMMKVEDSHSNDSKSPNQGQCPSPLGKDGSQNRRLKKYENDDIPQEKVVRIYQEELAKLMGRRMDDPMRGPRDQFPSLLFPHFFSGGNPMDRTQEEIRMALDAYHRELAKLNTCPSPGNIPGGLPGLLALQQQVMNHQHQHTQLNGVAQDLSLPKERKEGKMSNGDLLMEEAIIGAAGKKDQVMMESVADVLRHAGSAFSLVRPKTEPGIGQQTQPSTGSSASSPLSNSILPPAMTPGEEFSGSAAASPLQRMASITNSLISQPNTPTHHSPSQRPLKAVLPPITQQQFDMFNNLNTEDIVKKVKESLSQYSISQRLFGESVLGLSQGSVSDLLARPKPWHMLTQKGREPFIRMKMFLEDDNAVHKLVASQYKIAPEKLMRTGSYAGGPSCPPLTKPLPPSSKMPPSDPMPNKGGSVLDVVQGSILPPSLQLMPPHPQPPPPPLMVTPPHAISALAAPGDLKKSQPSMHPHHQSSAMRALQQHITPSVYEMAALTQDLDTQTITTKIKEALLANNIGQKIFGEAVLGLSQGSVSELLSKPKPWHMLSIKGREPFIRMQLWLTDAHNVDRLQALKNERREANKRRRSSGAPGADNSSDTSSNDTSEFYHSPSPGPPSAKKQRVLFSEEQKEALRLAFALDSYPNVATIEFLGSELALSSRTITNWFHNHRMRLKQQVPHADGHSQQVSRDPAGAQQPFDPVQFRLLLNQRLLELQKERMGLGAVPLPYPPYFAANNNLAALIGRGLLPTSGDCDLQGPVSKEQFSGLDLSMGGLKREADYDDEEDAESNAGSEDSNMSAASDKKPPPATARPASRRKPAAPQWVNPEWQETDVKDKPGEVIINGVCVMRSGDYGIKTNDGETVRVEPTPVQDGFDDDSSEASSERIAERISEPPTSPMDERTPGDDGAEEPKEDEEEEEEARNSSDGEEKEWKREEGSGMDSPDKRIKIEDPDDRWEY